MDNCALYSPYATHTLLPPFSQCISLRCSVRSNLCTSLLHVTYHVCLRGSSRTENARARTDTFTIVFSQKREQSSTTGKKVFNEVNMGSSGRGGGVQISGFVQGFLRICQGMQVLFKVRGFFSGGHSEGL